MCSLSEWELWFAWWSPDLPDDLESSVTCVSIRSTECQVRFPILWSHCHMSKSIRLRLLVDCFPENVCSSPFVIAFCSRKSNCMEVINELMTESTRIIAESKVTAPPAGRAEAARLAKKVNMSSLRKGHFKPKEQSNVMKDPPKLSTRVWSKEYRVHLLHVQCPCFSCFLLGTDAMNSREMASLRVKQVTILFWNLIL